MFHLKPNEPNWKINTNQVRKPAQKNIEDTRESTLTPSMEKVDLL